MAQDLAGIPRQHVEPDSWADLARTVREMVTSIESLERGATLRNASISGGQGLRIIDENNITRAQLSPDGTVVSFDGSGVPVVRQGTMVETGAEPGNQPYGIEVRVNATDWLQLGTAVVDWANVGSKPAAYDAGSGLWDPTAHTHVGADVTSRVASAVDAIGSASGFANNVMGTQFYALWVGNDGQWSLGRNTSSIRYKFNVRDAVLDPAAVLRLRPRVFDRKAQYRAPVDDEGNRVEGPERQVPGAVDEFGLIAEEVLPLAPQLIQYFEGEVDGVRYELVGVALIPVVRNHEERVEQLESTIVTQADQIARLTAAVKSLGGDV